jgi:hypothetical protein
LRKIHLLMMCEGKKKKTKKIKLCKILLLEKLPVGYSKQILNVNHRNNLVGA